MKAFYQNYPPQAHPMGILAAMVNAMRSFYPELMDLDEEMNNTFLRLISKIRTMAAMSYKFSIGQRVTYPQPGLCYCANFLNMMFDSDVVPTRSIRTWYGRSMCSGFSMQTMSRTVPPRP